MNSNKRDDWDKALADAVAALSLAMPPRPGFCYRNGYDFVKTHGRPFAVIPMPSGVAKGAPRMCFGNAILYAVLHGWHYVEGYALPGLGVALPIHHAWNVTPAGDLRDVTWMNTGTAYLGVKFNVGRADDATWNGDASVLDDYRRGHRLLRKRWRGDNMARQWPPSEGMKVILSTAAAIKKMAEKRAAAGSSSQ